MVHILQPSLVEELYQLPARASDTPVRVVDEYLSPSHIFLYYQQSALSFYSPLQAFLNCLPQEFHQLVIVQVAQDPLYPYAIITSSELEILKPRVDKVSDLRDILLCPCE